MIKIKHLLMFITVYGAVFFGCAKMMEPEQQPYDTGPVDRFTIDAYNQSNIESGSYSPGVYSISTEEKSHITINNLNGNTVYLIHINASGQVLGSSETKIVSTWERSGSAAGAAAAQNRAAVTAETLPEAEIPVRYDFEDAVNFKPLPRSGTDGGAASARSLSTRSAAASLVDPGSYLENVSERKFWVRRETGSQEWYELTATLRAKNDACFVWVADENFDPNNSDNHSDNKISLAQAQEFAQKFNVIYQKETTLFGYEYGGGPGGGGGVDSLKPVQIFAYDISEDYTSNQTGGIVGYFWMKDEYTQAELDVMHTVGETYKTNLAEMFYMDIHFIDRHPELAYSTSIHEFQHMIHYNQKNVIHKKMTSTWYNEMLSMLAEDVLCEYINIQPSNPAHPVAARIPLFLSEYNVSGVTEWLSGGGVYNSYAASYAFGAYLVRNFGGAALVHEMITNDDIDEASILMAVKSMNDVSSWTFNTLLEKFAETVVFTGSSGKNMSFNKTHAGAVSGVSYTFKGFDIGAIVRKTGTGTAAAAGPAYFKPDGAWMLRPNGFAAVSSEQWTNVHGSLTLNLNKPYAATKIFVMIK
ncbi:MAG: hypothetical protein LBD20_08400 [Spirochaetaceae bacterium]|jgi:hypothetical protein|nr:hypothetical protein [Spirochaetaceae bacterium]